MYIYRCFVKRSKTFVIGPQIFLKNKLDLDLLTIFKYDHVVGTENFLYIKREKLYIEL
jgi:hypothetical protein